MPRTAATAAMRFVIYGLVAMSLYSGYRYYAAPTLRSADPSHTYGSLSTGAPLPDGRTPLSRRTVAVADLHGDLQHAINVLSMASVVSPTPDASGDTYTWVGGHDVLVSTGDIVDRGDDTIALYRLFISLREQAARAGGEVKNCLGNHEVMNALGDWRYVTPGDVESFGGVEARRHAMSDQGWIGRDWMEHYNVTHTIALLPPTHPALPANYSPPRMSFVHGGITPHYASLGTDHINTLGQSFLRKALSQPQPAWLPPNTTHDEQELWSEHGPLWYRGYASDPPALACPNAAAATSALRVNHLVMGHTPHFDGFVTRCNNSILLIDTGISKAYGGEQSALIIDLDLLPLPLPANSNPQAQKPWIEKRTLTALYRGRKPKILSATETKLWL
ncbi:hypothetical protein EX895_005566 [Sporisorium graminicola]|uniref:Calcineurin-like phosphoesterase domain-containing protein n=1 Tax=Sporisorium graminicola TaxID=280036 RepID=A0A4U7KMK3_9BASI|nr:hypothetical protein EX895_005566 [Sporisorium graminicola]TKY85404.1 hypothetical protein EX895_005566 [Sporisorium graminicola]